MKQQNNKTKKTNIMGAPKFNQYWKERQKHGRNKLFEEPDAIIELAQQYIEYCENNPIIVEDFIKSGQNAGQIIKLERPRIPTQLGFTVFLGITEQTLNNYKSNENYKDFFESFAYVCSLFTSELTDNAVTGQANPAISSMILGLKQKTDITSNDKDIQGIGNIVITREDYKSISEDLEKI